METPRKATGEIHSERYFELAHWEEEQLLT
jgi:hypothetical protein